MNHQLKATLLTVVLACAAGCGHNSQTVAPSALTANPSSYDEQDITVSGTAKNPMTRQTPRGTFTRYQLCDTACINVVAFGESSVAAGSQQTVTGRFHATFGHRRVFSNVLVVGGRNRP
jgi:hypothetical protein